MPNPLACKVAQQERQQVGEMPYLVPVHIAMPRFFFDLSLDAFTSRDEVGSEIDSLHMAELEAKRTAGELTRDRLILWPGATSEAIRVEVKDEQRQPVLTVTVLIQVDRAGLTPPYVM